MPRHHRLSKRRHWYDPFLTWGPWVISVVFVVGMANNRLRRHMLPHLRENGPLELATFAVCLIAGILGLWTALESRKVNPWWKTTFFTLFGLGLVFVAMEEIAWGQTFFGFGSPEYFESNNLQQETTLHNLGGAHGKSHYLYMAFGLGGLLGVFLPGRQLSDLRVPRVAVSTLIVIVLMTSFEFLHNNFELDWSARGIGRKSPELIEFWVACVGLIYCGDKWRKLRQRNNSDAA
jgi:hypothetical protein